jgi:beta-lactamase regulating signal transducer with metallopeptidase domain
MTQLQPWLSWLTVASLKGSIILVAAFLVLRGMRRSSADARHAILAIALVAFLVVPIATALAPAWTVIALPGIPAPVMAALQGVLAGVPAADGTREAAAVSESDATVSSTPAAATATNIDGEPATGENARSTRAVTPAVDGLESPSPDSSAGAETLTLPPLRDVLVGIWLAGAAIIVLRLLLGVARLRTLSKRATMMTDGSWLQSAHAIARRLGLRRGVTLLRGDREAVPMTWGVLTPVVWLPPAADAWPAELRDSVLSHELAHVRRRDAVTQWLANAAVALHWFNPLVWIATRALRAERERACDDTVLALGAAPDDYAAHLLDMVRTLGAASGPAPAMAMARRSQFEGRLLAILDRACSRGPIGGGRVAAASVGAMMLVLVLGGLRSTAASAPEPEQGTVLSVPPVTLVEPPATPVPPRGLPLSMPAPDAKKRPSRAGAVESRRSEPTDRDSVASIGTASQAETQSHTELLDVSVPAIEVPATPNAPPFQARLSARADTALLLDVIAAAEGISSSTERTAVLERIANLPDLAPTVVTALARAASRITSSSSRAKLLRTMVRNQPAATGESRRALLGALSGVTSSEDMASVLELFVRRENIDDEALADAFIAASRITSSNEKARVLILAARHRRPDSAARAAYVRAAGTITNGSDRARALSALFEEPPRGQPPA